MTLESLSESQNRLANSGFVDDLIAVDGRLRSARTGTDHDPAELRAVEIVRYEGTSDPDDEAVLVAVATTDGIPLGTFTTPYGPAASSEQAEVLRHLHRIVLDATETSEHSVHDHIAAVFSDRASAEKAIDDLREVGLGSDHIGAAIHQSDRVVFERDEEHDMVDDVAAGVGAGAVLGVLGGMVLFAVALPGVGILGAGGLAALGASSGIGGAMLGMYAGVAAAGEEVDEHQRLRLTHLQPGEVMVVACAHDHQDLVESALQRHGGRLVSARPPGDGA